MGWKSILESLQQGAKLSLVVAAACAAAGIVIGVINLSGLGLRFTGLLVELASGNLPALLVLTMFASIILGMGLPPVAAYIVLAVLAAPAMIDLGVAPMAAHLFIFYFGILSAITPPVAIASYAAAGIAQSDPFRTSLIAVRLGLAAFLVPFMFVYGPPLLLIGSLGAIVVAFISALVGVTALAISLEDYLTKPIHVVSRCLMFIGALLLINVGIMADLAGLLLMAIVIFYELFIRKGRVSQVKEEIGM